MLFKSQFAAMEKPTNDKIPTVLFEKNFVSILVSVRVSLYYQPLLNDYNAIIATSTVPS